MLALFILPALLGVALIVNAFDDDNDDAEVTPSPEDFNQITAEPGQDAIEGTSGADSIIANDLGNEILGFGGGDYIDARGGNDAINSGSGNDTVYAGAGDDFVTAGAGDDRVFLGDGDDEYLADDSIEEFRGDDFVRGGEGRDFIVDSLGSNELRGDLGRDTLVAFDNLNEFGVYQDESERGTTDTLIGGFGDDILAGDDGDVMTGGAGADSFWITDDEEYDQEEVRITDFDTDEDTLFVTLTSNGNLPEPVGLTYDADVGAVRATYEGRAIAFLEGLTEADIPDIQTAVVRLDDLDRAIA
jgi:Ca2+-binding RTX toxin-like protein